MRGSVEECVRSSGSFQTVSDDIGRENSSDGAAPTSWLRSSGSSPFIGTDSGYGRGAPRGVAQQVYGTGDVTPTTPYTPLAGNSPRIQDDAFGGGSKKNAFDAFEASRSRPSLLGTVAGIGGLMITAPIRITRTTVRTFKATKRGIKSGVQYISRPLRRDQNLSVQSFVSVYSEDSDRDERDALVNALGIDPRNFQDPDFERKFRNATPPCAWKKVLSACFFLTLLAAIVSYGLAQVQCGFHFGVEKSLSFKLLVNQCVLSTEIVYLKFISIPIVAMAFTWFHIWLALQMMFYPVSFLGLWQYSSTGLGIGWQGVVPRKARKMAEIAFVQAQKHFLQPRQIFERLDGRAVCLRMQNQFSAVVRKVLPATAKKMNHLHTYDRLPQSAKRGMEERTMHIFEQTVQNFCDELPDIIEEVLDVHDMIVSSFTEDRALLNTFFIRMGSPEFSFLENCGATMGLLFGILQFFIWTSLPTWMRFWFLPCFGFWLGILTNFIAITWCFRPLEPIHITFCGTHVYTFHGLFLRRQNEVCRDYSALLTAHFFNIPKLMNYLQLPQNKRAWDKLETLFNKHSDAAVDKWFGIFKDLVQDVVGQEEFVEVKKHVRDETIKEMQDPDTIKMLVEHFLNATQVEATNCYLMTQMTSSEFECLLHPAFQEDEWILILVGGVLGAIVGLGQAWALGG